MCDTITNCWARSFVPRTVEIYDAGRESRTILKLDKLEYNAPMKDEDFTLEALRRGN